jgi:hypothetical protein
MAEPSVQLRGGLPLAPLPKPSPGPSPGPGEV